MAFKRDDIVIRFGGDDSRFQKVAKGVKRTGFQLAGVFGDIGRSVQSLFRLGSAGVLAGVAAAFAGMAKSALGAADALAKTADKIGVGIENLQRLRYAASASGVEQNVLDMAMQRFSRRVGEAAAGTGVLFKVLQELRIPLRDAAGNLRPVVDVLGDYADAIQAAEGPQERLRLAFKAFDSEGAALVNMLSGGKRGMQELMGVADELGLVIGENTVRASERLNQAWDDFAQRWATGWKSAILDMVTWMDKLAGNYRTLEDVENRLTDAQKELAQAEDDAAKKSGRNAAGARARVAQLVEEIAELEKKRDVLQKINDLQKANRGQPDPDVSGGDGGAGKKSRSKTGAKGGGSGVGGETDFYAERAANLELFQRGKRSRADFRVRSEQLKAAEKGKEFGPDSEKVLRDRVKAYEGTSKRAPLAVEVDQTALDGMSQQIQDFLAKQGESGVFVVKIVPELVGMPGADAIEDAAAAEGSRSE